MVVAVVAVVIVKFLVIVTNLENPLTDSVFVDKLTNQIGIFGNELQSSVHLSVPSYTRFFL